MKADTPIHGAGGSSKCTAQAQAKAVPFARQAGFSLIEIMVAVSLLALIIVGLLAMFYQVQRAFRAGVAQSDVLEGGRATVTSLAREVQEATSPNIYLVTNLVIVPSDFNTAIPPQWGRASVQDLPSGGGVTAQNRFQDFWYLTERNGDWMAVVYRIEGAANGVGTLYRWNEVARYESNPFLMQSAISNLTYRAGNALKRFNLPLASNTNFHRILDGVVHFTVEAYNSSGAFHTNAVLNIGGYDFGYYDKPPISGGPFTTNLLPASLEFELRVLEPATLAKFRTRAEVDLARARDNYLRERIGQTHTFRQRIPLRTAGMRPSEAF